MRRQPSIPDSLKASSSASPSSSASLLSTREGPRMHMKLGLKAWVAGRGQLISARQVCSRFFGTPSTTSKLGPLSGTGDFGDPGAASATRPLFGDRDRETRPLLGDCDRCRRFDGAFSELSELPRLKIGMASEGGWL
eukprot:CAMPEP_0197634098 /NCGR_PEP_ID=MMETSP1338-20131121/10298_1 /TAXON_ID=43686 ORGANISM="Pelagodinium beii, Strain RCC1491" /NCGR_SAMPLE_ID=MMETSP1338 /ASSEMBLY_ACC=CAM_ASM_000754 /LENGTH=136 /DNA_ID=CAMNT_0043205901 /DNA_START=255 /DNA_END=662 /DNA_ORIENTATION=+